ncbi:hypothetical protein B4589_004425 [Halolamina sp. CBA1230]|uniref:hypothetical protein n=1 Tax=Halolamina sp. CBA1230 TaxID=1853690 RepID=UPI0009A185A3|nr:hypothetical protein [Halolamina sp. CBA1230]QKY19661.1 hypothetical protein B4589_004425 [Halolamina sp. CBA1230]
MRLSPFNRNPDSEDWFVDAPLYGGEGYDITYEIMPMRSDEDVSNYDRIPRNGDDLDKEELAFDFSSAMRGSDYVEVYSSFDRPSIKWYSRSEFKAEFRYDPLNPPKPQDVDETEWEQLHERRIAGSAEPTIHDTEDRVIFLDRIARLWNGESVCGVHLLWDQCPAVTDLTADLDHDDLNHLYYNTNLGWEIILTFADADWFDYSSGFLKSTTLLRKPVWYDLTQAGRTRINNDDDLPDLHGDLNEGLTHRVTVGLTVLDELIAGHEVQPYAELDAGVVDVVSKDAAGRRYAIEILTDHHGWGNYEQTYRKLRELFNKGFQPIVVFDTRATAYKVFNYWLRERLAELPNGTFDSDYSISKGREQIQAAYNDSNTAWIVSDWSTTWRKWEDTLGPNGPELTREQILSINW